MNDQQEASAAFRNRLTWCVFVLVFPSFKKNIRLLKSRVKIMVDGTLLISSLIPEDSGNYTCMPTNGLLTPPTASANLTVMRQFLSFSPFLFFSSSFINTPDFLELKHF